MNINRHGVLEPLKQLSSQGNINVDQSVILIDGICNSELHRPDHGKTIFEFDK